MSLEILTYILWDTSHGLNLSIDRLLMIKIVEDERVLLCFA